MDQTMMPQAGSNLPPPDEATLDQFEARVAALVENANRWIKERPELTTEEEATKARDFKAQVAAQWKAVEAERKRLKDPLLAQERAIDDRYNPLKRTLETIKARLVKLETARLRRKEIEIERQRELAFEREEQARREAAEAARAAEREDATIQERMAAEEAERQAMAAEKEAARAERAKPQIASAYGERASGMRTFHKIKIVDVAKIDGRTLKKLCRRPYVVEALERALREDLELARKTPGVEVIEERRAV